MDAAGPLALRHERGHEPFRQRVQVAIAFVGNAVSGGTVPFAFLPDGFRQVAPWLPDGAIVAAARHVVYLPGTDLGHPLLVLGLRLAVSLAVLAGTDRLHLAERRRTP